MTSEGSAAGAVDGGLDDPQELEPEQGTLALAAEGDTSDRADWEAAAAAVLRKARRLADDDPDALVWERLTQRTLDGVDVTPLGTPEDLDGLVTSGRPQRTGEWDVRAHLRLAAGEEQEANETLLVDLEGGVTSLWLTLPDGADLVRLLDGVLLDLAPVVLDAPTAPVAAAAALLALAADRGVTVADGTNLGVTATAAEDDLVAVARLAHDHGLLGVVVDATDAHDRGASDAQELGRSLQLGARVLRVLTGAGLDVDQAASLVEHRLAATDEQLTTIAKLRAARRLWDRVLELSGASEQTRVAGQRQHVVTSRPMMSRYDPYVNILRTTVAAFSAGVGGAEAVTVLPFDSPLGRPGTLGRRVARNTSHLLVSESHVARVADPAGGAYAVERLTDDLAAAAWEVLGRLDAAADPDAELDALVSATAAERDEQVATRARPITGLTEFPAVDEELPQREPDGAWDGVRPWGHAFEALRDEPATGRVFLATLGPVASHTARATFATNLLTAGGIGVDAAGATDGVEALLEAYDGQPVACLAGADPVYADWGAAAVTALREAGATRVVVAGRPRDLGVDDSCAVGVDALAFLTRTREVLA
ncbi:putative methylmalonyl-CoA mutase small subunit [Nocardioides aquaticus]|uniref:Methylmalonyl-CoA mutase small subunit n=1 Tax=Nocardioides aquaticus TaxID=160826 RepID=A0ABX8EED5_9ACTN|nr:methylmalonyl-CoA mutase family protein [Nocardioides aquaticus]QVT78819.1 putative methylmalonyl-CoA mutase small subunit [Nocardioides aquaticus]